MSVQTPTRLRQVPDVLPPAKVAAGLEPRLVVTRPDGSPLGLDGERELGYLACPPSPESVAALVDALQKARLQGRGGAGFPAYVKWSSVAATDGPTVMVANGHEGEPASGKDRWLLLNRPHLVLEGLLLASASVHASRTVICVSRDDTEAAVRAALDEIVAVGLMPVGVGVEVFRSDHRYVAGEESSIVRAINGGPGLPTAKPPRPYEKGVDDLPTLVQNVETLAHVAWIHRHGPSPFAEVGTRNSAGSALFTILGGPDGCTIVEAPLGTKLVDLFALAGIEAEDVSRVLLGGWFGGVHGPEVLGLEACFTALKVAGSGLGCASMTVIGPDEDVKGVVADLGAWYARESARQCGVCRNGTASIGKALARNADDTASDEDFENLARWGVTLTGRGACAFIDGAATLARTTVAVVSAKQHMATTHTQKEQP